MAAVLKHWREAASLIIVAPSCLQPSSGTVFLPQAPTPNSNSKGNDGIGGAFNSDYKTLLLKRSSKSKFMPNNYVFPGGVAVNNDFSAEWISVFRKVGKDFQISTFDKVSKGSSRAAPMITRRRDPQFSEIPSDVAFRICAIRETFEESGVLIVRHVKELQQKEKEKKPLSEQWNFCSSLFGDVKFVEWRKQVNENPNNFLKMCQEMNLVPDILALYEWTNWLTPTMMGGGAGKRFDTIFYICCLDHMPKVDADNAETVYSQWDSPTSILSNFYSKQKVGLAPPQVYELSRLLHFKKASELMKFSAERESERIERWFPVIVFSNDYIISLLPGDDLYPKDPDFDTPNQMIQYDMTMEELDKGVTHFHRNFGKKTNGRGPICVKCNVVFQNKHVAPVLDFDKKLVSYGKL